MEPTENMPKVDFRLTISLSLAQEPWSVITSNGISLSSEIEDDKAFFSFIGFSLLFVIFALFTITDNSSKIV